MKKKNLIFTMFALIVITTSCGPKRYGCGPRRCEVKMERTSIPTAQKLNAAFV